MTASLLVFEAIIFIIWFTSDPPLPAPNFGDWICFSTTQATYELALKGYKLLLIVFTAFLAYSIRQVQLSQFNESQHIAFSVYNIMFTFILVNILQYNITKLKPTFIVTSAGTLIIMLGILATLFMPKLYNIYCIKMGKGKNLLETKGTGTGTGTFGSRGPSKITRLASSGPVTMSSLDSSSKHPVEDATMGDNRSEGPDFGWD